MSLLLCCYLNVISMLYQRYSNVISTLFCVRVHVFEHSSSMLRHRACDLWSAVNRNCPLTAALASTFECNHVVILSQIVTSFMCMFGPGSSEMALKTWLARETMVTPCYCIPGSGQPLIIVTYTRATADSVTQRATA